jgi:hypothetical protein
MATDEHAWEISRAQDSFEIIKREKWFWQLIALAGVVNAIRFAQAPLGLVRHAGTAGL